MEAIELVNLAKDAMKNAYAPYSGYYVGAALLTKSGKIYQGCNIENVAFSPTNCAERTAFFKAISEGEREFEAMAIVGGKLGNIKGIAAPCGVCRQVMLEFCDKDKFKVYLGKEKGEYEEYTLGEIMPVSFDKEELACNKKAEVLYENV